MLRKFFYIIFLTFFVKTRAFNYSEINLTNQFIFDYFSDKLPKFVIGFSCNEYVGKTIIFYIY